MATDVTLNRYLGQGDDAAEAAYTPVPSTGTTPEQAVLYVNNEDPANPRIDWWDGATFVSTQGAGGGTVTNTGTLTANQLIKGNGTTDITVGDLSGDVTTAGTMATTIGNAKVTLAKIANAGNNSRILGSGSSGSGASYSELTAGAGLTIGASSVALSTPAKTRAITLGIDGGGSTITTGIKADVYVPYACTITAVTMLADASGSIVVDIWKDTLANYPPTGADSITASAKPTISTATNSQDTTLTGWTTTISAGDTLRFNVDSATTIARLSLVLTVTVA